MVKTDPGLYDEHELENSIAKKRLDTGLLRARAWCSDVQAMCMYADWLLHQALMSLDTDDAQTRLTEARTWLKRAAENGSTRASGMLGDILLEYPECADDRHLGAELLRTSAANGDAAAMRRLGERIINTDRRSEARRWLIKAAASGDAYSSELLETVNFIAAE